MDYFRGLICKVVMLKKHSGRSPAHENGERILIGYTLNGQGLDTSITRCFKVVRELRRERQGPSLKHDS